MDGTFSSEEVREAASNSLHVLSSVYSRRADGSYQIEGIRPGPGWVGHGYFSRSLWVFEARRLRQVLLFKHRWLSPGKTHTCHSRAPNEMAQLSMGVLGYVIAIFGWLQATVGLHSHTPLLDDLGQRPSPRTLQRWLKRALPNARKTQQAFRLAVIERCEPRPVETLFPRGLSPPIEDRRHWRNLPAVSGLWQAYAFTIGASMRLSIPAAILLAEARGSKINGETRQK